MAEAIFLLVAVFLAGAAFGYCMSGIFASGRPSTLTEQLCEDQEQAAYLADWQRRRRQRRPKEGTS